MFGMLVGSQYDCCRLSDIHVHDVCRCTDQVASRGHAQISVLWVFFPITSELGPHRRWIWTTWNKFNTIGYPSVVSAAASCHQHRIPTPSMCQVKSIPQICLLIGVVEARKYSLLFRITELRHGPLALHQRSVSSNTCDHRLATFQSLYLSLASDSRDVESWSQ